MLLRVGHAHVHVKHPVSVGLGNFFRNFVHFWSKMKGQVSQYMSKFRVSHISTWGTMKTQGNKANKRPQTQAHTTGRQLRRSLSLSVTYVKLQYPSRPQLRLSSTYFCRAYLLVPFADANCVGMKVSNEFSWIWPVSHVSHARSYRHRYGNVAYKHIDPAHFLSCNICSNSRAQEWLFMCFRIPTSIMGTREPTTLLQSAYLITSSLRKVILLHF